MLYHLKNIQSSSLLHLSLNKMSFPTLMFLCYFQSVPSLPTATSCFPPKLLFLFFFDVCHFQGWRQYYFWNYCIVLICHEVLILYTHWPSVCLFLRCVCSVLPIIDGTFAFLLVIYKSVYCNSLKWYEKCFSYSTRCLFILVTFFQYRNWWGQEISSEEVEGP